MTPPETLPPSPPPPQQPSPPPARRFHLRRVALQALLAFLVVPLLLVLAGLWLILTESGLRALALAAETASGGALQLRGVSGRLAGPLAVERLDYVDARLRLSVRGLRLAWSPRALLAGVLVIDEVHVDDLDLARGPAPPARAPPPRLAPPFPLRVERFQVERLRLLPWSAQPSRPLAQVERIRGALDADRHVLRLRDFQALHERGRLDADLALDTQAPNLLTGRFSAQLRGLRPAGSIAPDEYRLRGDVSGPLQDFRLRADAEGGALRGHADLALTPFAATPLKSAAIAVEGIDPAALVQGAPQGQLQLNAQLSALGQGLGGPVEIVNQRPASLDRQGIPLSRVQGRLEWQGEQLRLGDLVLIQAARRVAQGTAELKRGLLAVDLQLHGLDPRDWYASLRSLPLDGHLQLRATAVAQTLQAHLDEASTRGGRRPLALDLDLRHQGSHIEVAALRLDAAPAYVEARGRLNWGAGKRFDLSGEARDLDPARFARLPSGRLNAHWQAQGEWPTAQLRFDLTDSYLLGAGRRRPVTGHADLALDGRQKRLRRGEAHLDLLGNRFDLSGAYGGSGDRLQLRIDAPHLEALGAGFGGRLMADLQAGGTPAAPNGQIRAEGAGLRFPGGLAVASLALSGDLGGGLDGPFHLSLDLAQLAAASRLAERLTLRVVGTRGRHQAQAALRVNADTAMELAAVGALGTEGERLAWRGSLEAGRISAPQLALRLKAPADLAWAKGEASLGRAEWISPSGRLLLAASRWSAQGWRSRGEFSGLQFGLPGQSGPPLSLAGSWDLQAASHLDGFLRVTRESGDVILPATPALALGLRQLNAEARADQDRLRLDAVAEGERLGRLDLRLSALVRRDGNGWSLARDAPLAGLAHIQTPTLAWLGPLLSPDLALGGRLDGELRLGGTPGRPDARGELHGHELSLSQISQGWRLEQGLLDLDFDQAQARLKRLSLRAPQRRPPPDARIEPEGLQAPGAGILSGSGELALADGRGVLRFHADRLALMQRPDRWLLVSGDARVDTAWDAVAVSGDLRADGAYFELPRKAPPRLSDDVVVLGRQARARQPLSLAVDLGIDLGDDSYFKGRGLDAHLKGSLRFQADRRSLLRARGSITVDQGSFDAYGQALTIERGILNFQGPVDNAGLNVRAVRKGLPVEAGVEIGGSLQRPQVRLVSQPEVPDAEKLSWIVLGHGPDQAGGADSGVLLSAATSILGGPDSSGGISRQLAEGLGLDQLSISSGSLTGTPSGSAAPLQTVGGTTFASRDPSLTSQILTFGKRLSADTYISYEQSLAGAASIVKLTRQLSRRLSLVARAGSDNSVDLRYSFSFR